MIIPFIPTGIVENDGISDVSVGCMFSVQFSSFQSLSCARLFATPRTAARQASLSITNSRSLSRLMSIESVMVDSAISSSFVPFSSCHQSLLASGSFQRSQLFTSGGQSTGVSASTSVLPMNTQDWIVKICSYIFGGFIVLDLTFRSMIHFELIFYDMG